MGDSIIGPPRVVGTPNLDSTEAPGARRAPVTDPNRTREATNQRGVDGYERGGSRVARGTTPAPIPPAPGSMTPAEAKRAQENRESFQVLESLRRGNGRIEEGSDPADHPAIRRGIERGLFTKADVEAANRQGEQRKREAIA